MVFSATFNNVSVISWRWDVASVKSNFSKSRWVSYYCSRNVISKISSLGLWLVKSIIRELWWDPYPPLIYMCHLMPLSVWHQKYRNLNEKPCYGLSAWGVILWLYYSSSLHIRKTCLINAKYIINCHNSYDYITYYCFDSHQMLANFKRHVKKNIRHFFHTFKSGKQKPKQESTHMRFNTIIRLYQVKKWKYIMRKCKEQ